MTTLRGSTEFLVGDGEMARLVRSKNWAATPLGPIETWPQSLLTTVSLCLASNFPINIIWGPDANQIYNDGYRVVCGEAHPGALGESYRVTWASAWPAIGEPFERARTGETSFLENQRMFLTRNGYLEETFFTFSLSPIRDETGGIGGLFHPVTETTGTMLAERRTRALRDLTASLASAETVADIGRLAVATLQAFDFDLPFLLVYSHEAGLAEAGVADYRLTAGFGAGEGSVMAPALIPAGHEAVWPLTRTAQGRDAIEVDALRQRFPGERCGPYEEAPDRAFVLPLTAPGADLPPAVIVVGVSPRLPLDDTYRAFFELTAAAIGAALINVRTREEERHRAEALAAIDKAKTAFFSNVSHEFRTPLTLMLGPLEDALAESDGLPQVQRERLSTANRNALRLLKLVNALLNFSRIEAGRLQAVFEAADLARMTADLASNFRSACERAGIDLVVDCQPGARQIWVDRGMWETIVLNLLSNAFKFTLEGGITLSLTETAQGVRFRIADTGVGIPPAELDKVFDRFHRIEGQGGRSHEGTGIGLSLVRELVDQHGGTITVESTVGRGTAFTIDLLAGTDHLNPDQMTGEPPPVTPPDGSTRTRAFVQEVAQWLPEMAEAAAEAGLAPVEGAPRVLLADDNADMRHYITQILEAAGYQVQAVGNGDEALAATRRAPRPDLVLSDVMMPGLDGFQLVAALRADPLMDDLPIILLSARAGEEARLEGLNSGADDYLVKPFAARELRARIDAAVRLARQRQDAAARERRLQTELSNERLRQTEDELAFALAAGRLGSWDIDLRTDVLVASEICRASFGFTPDEPFSREAMVQRVHPADLDRRADEIAEAVEQRADLDLEYRVLQPDGAVTWVLVRGRAAYDSAGKPVRLAGVTLDITERKRGEERQKLLLDELNHRVKNTLSTVQSITLQTRRTMVDPAQFNDAVESRLVALSNAHDLLTRASWDDVSLEDLLRLTLRPYPAHRITIEGPLVRLVPTAAVTLNMAFHELATNAAKYGSLSAPEGALSITWSIAGQDGEPAMVLQWRESGGPAVVQPSRRGFGSRLLERGLSRQMGGSVALDFDPAGLTCTLRMPLSGKLQAQAEPA